MKQPQEGKRVVPVAKKGVITGKESAAEAIEAKASHKEETIAITKKGGLKMNTKTAFPGFETLNVSENALKVMKYSLDTTFESIAKAQEFSDMIIKETINTNKQMQANAEKIVSEWIENGKKGLDDYKKVVEEGYKTLEGLLQPQS